MSILRFHIILLAIFTLSGCSKSEEAYISGEPAPGQEVNYEFSLNMPVLDGGISTYGLSADDENNVSTVDVLVFSAVGSTEVYSYRTYMSSIERGDKAGSITGSVKLKADARGTMFRLVFVINSREMLDKTLASGGIIAGSTDKESVLKKLIFDRTNITLSQMPMCGESSKMSLLNTDGNGSDFGYITVLRALARVNVGLNISSSLEAAGIEGVKIQEVYVCNVNSKGYLSPLSGSNIVQGDVTTPVVPSGSQRWGVVGGVSADGKSYLREIYIPESIESTNQWSESNAAVLVNCLGEKASQTGWYRIDFWKESGGVREYMNILRNNSYTFNITAITGQGASTMQEALSQPGKNITVGISSISDSRLNNIVSDGKNQLAITSTQQVIDYAEYNGELSVYTDAQLGWEATVISGSEWCQLLSGATTVDKISGAPGIKGVVKFRAQENFNPEHRQAVIKVTAGMFSKEFVVRQEEPNSYILNVNSSVEIPVRLPLNFWGVGGSMSASVLWKDNRGNVVSPDVTITGSGRDARLVVRSGNVQGNAVVRLSVNSKTVWSWHLWVTDYVPERDFNIDGDVVLMDRNMGALSNVEGSVGTLGVLYQWGRKDPFPGSSGMTGTSDKVLYDSRGNVTPLSTEYGPLSISRSVEFPMSFIKVSEWEGDWLAGTTSIPRWDASGKSVFDPCPRGWSVPSSQVFSAIKRGQRGTYGFRHGALGFYPTAGIRRGSSTVMEGVSSYARVWCSEYVSGDRDAMAFFAEGRSGNGTGKFVIAAPPSDALAVRCAQHLLSLR